MPSHGERLRSALTSRALLPLMGVYDSYSAALVARHFDGLFLSGFSFAAAFYGLPDEGFITWTDLAAATQRVRSVAPSSHLLVDMDDGYGDPVVAAHAAATFEEHGASGIVLEDQLRPKKCGHLDGKQLMDLDGYLEKLAQVVAARRKLVVVARTDAADPDERLRRARAFDQTGCDAILVDGLGADMKFLPVLRAAVKKPLVFNQIAGGKAAPQRWSDLHRAGFSLVIHSTPCLFAAHQAIEAEMRLLRERDGRFIESGDGRVGLADVNAHLQENLAARHGRLPGNGNGK
jgi:2-methylisocitrate lyase-like PEP mutase family enzyme